MKIENKCAAKIYPLLKRSEMTQIAINEADLMPSHKALVKLLKELNIDMIIQPSKDTYKIYYKKSRNEGTLIKLEESDKK